MTAGAWDVTNGVAPLHLAAAKGHAELVEVLLEAGAPIDAHDGDGATAVQVTDCLSIAGIDPCPQAYDHLHMLPGCEFWLSGCS